MERIWKNCGSFLKAVMRLKVDLRERNPALVSLFENPRQTIFLDANFFIPPDRTKVGAKAISFQKYCEIWLDPVFYSFSDLAIHESVYGELVAENVRRYADAKSQELSGLRVYSNAELNAVEAAMMQTYINKIAPFSKYIPSLRNSEDRGEVLSLAYMASKGFLYFASNDNLPFQLIRKADELDTGLQDMRLLEMFDVIFYLYRVGEYDNKGLRLLYKYQYYLTRREKLQNPDWGDFIKEMNLLYLE